jgi:glycosyltransferase involved in cell wall biosynthesis
MSCVHMDLSVCLVATELFAWGKYGGFGMCTRTIGRELVKRGVKVSVVVPRGHGQRPVETLDGMTVLSFKLHAYPNTGALYRRCDADIYHSEEPSWGSRVAMKAMPTRKHVATSQNPKTEDNWKLVDRYYPLRRRLFNRLFDGTLKETVRRMDAVYCQARYTIQKVKELYGLEENPLFLPNPVELALKRPDKAVEPTVCFLGRFDGEKRPELFFDLARRFPEVRFSALGSAHDLSRDRRLRRAYGSVPNLELPGFVTGDGKDRVLNESWILVNTSVSECLPVSFLEAAAHGCAILSFNDPDGFASSFGFHAAVEKDLDRGLRFLLEDDRWKMLGERGFSYVSETHEIGRVVDMHMNVYRQLLEKG